MTIEYTSYATNSERTGVVEPHSLTRDTIVVVNHGSNNSVERPNSAVVYWIGSVEPINALNYDIWVDTSV
jgi:hypothetical protein